MLHEVLLALSGHPSPLFKDNNAEDNATQDFPLLSASERALLSSIGQLSELHRKLRSHIEHIAAQHASMVCRAVATSIQQVHLPRFQTKILEVESRILTKDASIVGAYDIVPLAAVVGEFEEWRGRMGWYWDLACFISPPSSSLESTGSNGCTGAALIDKLRTEQQTGFPDIEEIAIELSKTAETAWLRQLVPWVLYGQLPKFGGDDFFVRVQDADGGDGKFIKDREKLPKFVTHAAASSIFFIGKSLHQVQRYEKHAKTSNAASVNSKTSGSKASNDETLRLLSTLPLPINPSQLSRAISAIRLSVSQNVLRHLLPMQTTLELLTCLKEFFLLSRSEFPATLIAEVDSRLEARQQSMGRLLQQDPVKALQGLSLKDSELSQTLAATWRSLASRDEDLEDDTLDFARTHISLILQSEADSRPSTADSVHGASATISPIAFNELLFPIATQLTLNITSPLDLFISQREVEIYSAINAYLLAIRRAQIRLSDLWRRTVARRDHPAPRQASHSASLSTASRQRDADRRVATRKVWATCSAAIHLISETSAYFSGEIIHESWHKFEEWVKTPISNEAGEGTPLSASTDSATDGTLVQRDPETLASAHRTFLAALTYALLLNDVPFTKELRSLLSNIDHLISFFNRVLDVRSKLDLEHSTTGASEYTAEEEQRYALELDRARKKVDSDLRSVVARLRELDRERIGSGRYLDTGVEESGFEPWRGGGVDRLLMKLEFGRVEEEKVEIL